MRKLITFKTPEILKHSIICNTITVEKGELGFIPSTLSNAIKCDDPEIVESLVSASMFGWNTPSAELANTWIEENLK